MLLEVPPKLKPAAKTVDVVKAAIPKIKGVSKEMIALLRKEGVTTLDGLADLSSEELTDMVGPLKAGKAEKIIMAARAHWFA